jgi:hypothetical protein
MFEVYTHSTHCSVEISQMAGVLGGICVEQAEKGGGFEQKFQFSLESKAEQFEASILWFPEVFGAGRKPSAIEQAIADSKLCDCGWTTRKACLKTCEAIADQLLELQQEFPTLDQLKGTHHEKQAS